MSTFWNWSTTTTVNVRVSPAVDEFANPANEKCATEPARNVTTTGPAVTVSAPIDAVAVTNFVSALVEMSIAENWPVASVVPEVAVSELPVPVTDRVTAAPEIGWPAEFRATNTMLLAWVMSAVTGPDAEKLDAAGSTPTAAIVAVPVAELSTPFDSVTLTTNDPTPVGAVTGTEQLEAVLVQPVTVPSDPALVDQV